MYICAFFGTLFCEPTFRNLHWYANVKNKLHIKGGPLMKKILSLLLCIAMLLCIAPAALAVNEDVEGTVLI